jgi:hypothetical protein
MGSGGLWRWTWTRLGFWLPFHTCRLMDCHQEPVYMIVMPDLWKYYY